MINIIIKIAKMKNVIYKIILILFCIYWTFTLFFIMPKNPLNLSVQKERDFFQANFFQRWSFFAPPPNYNQRVYFVYKNKLTSKKDIFEVIKPILDKKHSTAPFNFYYQTLDYILASSLINIEGNVRLLQDVLTHENFKATNNLKLSDSIVTQKIVSDIEKTTDFKTLAKYAKKIALENKIYILNCTYKIKISKKYIPQFIDRNIDTGKEEISFSSHFLEF